MAEEPGRPSASPPPPPPRAPALSWREIDDGWRPGREDEGSIRAIEFHARHGEAVALETRADLGKLERAVEANSTATNNLAHVFDLGASAAAARWKTAGRIAWAAAGILGGSALLGAARLVWLFVSTLHH